MFLTQEYNYNPVRTRNNSTARGLQLRDVASLEGVVWCRDQDIGRGSQIPNYMETICLSSQPLDNIDVATTNCMSSKDWRASQLRDPIIGHFVRSLINGARPTRNKVPISIESNTLFRDLDHLSCDKGVLYRKTKINGEERKQLVLPINNGRQLSVDSIMRQDVRVVIGRCHCCKNDFTSQVCRKWSITGSKADVLEGRRIPMLVHT